MRAALLIVEDDALVATDVSTSLGAAGYRIVGCARTGPEALQVAAAARPALALVDIRLSGPMSGIDLAHELWAAFAVPVVFASAYSDERTLHEAKRALPVGYLVKPFDARELITTIEVGLQLAERARHHEASAATGLGAEVRGLRDHLAFLARWIHEHGASLPEVHDAREAVQRLHGALAPRAAPRHDAGPLSPRPDGVVWSLLIVDDEPDVARAIARVFRDCRVVVELDAPAVLDRLRAGERYDAILCDVHMAQLSGIQLHAQVAREVPEQATRFVFVTGAHSPEVSAYFAAIGNAVVTKPFEAAELRAQVERTAARP